MERSLLERVMPPVSLALFVVAAIAHLYSLIAANVSSTILNVLFFAAFASAITFIWRVLQLRPKAPYPSIDEATKAAHRLLTHYVPPWAVLAALGLFAYGFIVFWIVTGSTTGFIAETDPGGLKVLTASVMTITGWLAIAWRVLQRATQMPKTSAGDSQDTR